MIARYGATDDEWAFWDLHLGLSTELLPTVCNPTSPIYKNSVLKKAGKIPSRYTRNREVVGFTKWAQYTPTSQDLDTWSKEEDYGICLQTRTIGAFDLDLEDASVVAEVVQLLHGHAYTLPVRSRSNSPRKLLLFRWETPQSKRVLETSCGKIELLGVGNQCVVAGQHETGPRYTWDPFDDIPVLSDAEISRLMSALRASIGTKDWTEGKSSKDRDPDAPAGPVDPAVAWLTAQGHVKGLGPGGTVYLVCPFASAHGKQNADGSQTVLFPAGTGGFQMRHIKCLDASCEGKTDHDFMQALGWRDVEMLEGFEAEPVLEEGLVIDALTASLGATGAGILSPVTGPRFDCAEGGAIKPLLQNVVQSLSHPDHCGATIQYDLFRDQLTIDYGQGPRKFQDTDYTELRLTMIAKGFGPGPISKEAIVDGANLVGHRREFDSAIAWITTLPPWDQISRIETFCPVYLGCEDTPYTRAVGLYWWTAHAGRVLVPGIQADMAIIMVAGQGTKKTSSVRAMVPHDSYYTSLSLDDQGPELVRQTGGRLIIEWEELRGMFTKDANLIKAWISARKDSLRHPYEKHPHDIPRRIIVVGTTNIATPLMDDTGNRRWLPLHVGEHQDPDSIRRDRDQLWAEAVAQFRTQGILYQEAERLAYFEHDQFEKVDIAQPDVDRWLDTTEPGLDASIYREGSVDPYTPRMRKFLLLPDVIKNGMKIEDRYRKAADEHRAGRILKRAGYKKVTLREKLVKFTAWVPL